MSTGGPPALCSHGTDFIDRCLRDDVHCGFFDVDLNGRPLRDGEKHVVPIAFAIFAAAKLGVSSYDRALAVARDGFAWLDRHAHHARGGYVEELHRDGSPQLAARTSRAPMNTVRVLREPPI